MGWGLAQHKVNKNENRMRTVTLNALTPIRFADRMSLLRFFYSIADSGRATRSL
jgi:hypothetical protein